MLFDETPNSLCCASLTTVEVVCHLQGDVVVQASGGASRTKEVIPNSGGLFAVSLPNLEIKGRVRLSKSSKPEGVSGHKVRLPFQIRFDLRSSFCRYLCRGSLLT